MKQPLNTRILTRAATVLTCAVCAVGLMTGCSQSSKADSAASASATSGDDYLLKMAKCMRDKGIDVSDPDANGNVQFPDNEAATKAAQECEQIVGPAPGTRTSPSPRPSRTWSRPPSACARRATTCPTPRPARASRSTVTSPRTS